jgi:hypothetical protein
MTFIRNRCSFAVAVAAACLAAPASAAAESLPSTYKTDAAQSGSTTSVPAGAAESTFPSADFRGGDRPIDHPGAGRAVTAAPTTIEVVRPERTIVRDVDEQLPLILSSTALLLVLAGLAITLVRTRMAQHS